MTTQHVISEDLFADALHRERRRADRSSQAMGLLLVSAPDGDRVDGSETWKAIVSGLAAAKRDTDVIGWFERGNAIGVILPDIEAPGPALARGLDARVRRHLSRFLGTTTTDSIATRFHFYPELTAAPGRQPLEVHPMPVSAPSRTWRDVLYDSAKRAIDIVGSRCPPAGTDPGAGHHCGTREIEVGGACVLQAAACGPDDEAVHDAEVPHDARERGQQDSPGVRQQPDQGESGVSRHRR